MGKICIETNLIRLSKRTKLKYTIHTENIPINEYEKIENDNIDQNDSSDVVEQIDPLEQIEKISDIEKVDNPIPGPITITNPIDIINTPTRPEAPKSPPNYIISIKDRVLLAEIQAKGN